MRTALARRYLPEPAPKPELRRFAVHAAAEGRHRSEIVWASGSEDAAVGFIEQHHPALDEEEAATVVVHDCLSGQEHCYRIHLGEAPELGACG